MIREYVSKLLGLLAVAVLMLQSVSMTEAGEIRGLADDANLGYRTVAGAAPEVLTHSGLPSVKEFEQFLDGVMTGEMKSRNLVGGVVSVVKDGQVYFSKGYGYADLENRRPVVAEEILFRPGSVSKLFTWTAVMQLVEQGKLDLDADVNVYLKTFQIPPAFDQPITLRHLMTHTAGFEDGAVGYLFVDGPEKIVPLNESLAAHIPARVRAPGDLGAYSNFGTALAGLIVSNVSGVSWEDYVERNILRPLGMKDSTFREPLPEPLSGRLSKVYNNQGLTKEASIGYVMNFGPAGSLSTTAIDMAKFMIAHLQGGEYKGARILRPETVEAMHARNFSPNPYVAGSGWGIYETYLNGRRVIGHGGSTLYFKTLLSLVEEENLGIFVSFNTPGGILASMDVTKAIMDQYFPAKLPDVEVVEGFAERASRYVGSYRPTRSAYKTNEKLLAGFSEIQVGLTDRGTLLVKNLMFPLQEFVEIRPDVFRLVNDETTIAFEGDDNGLATALVGPLSFLSATRLNWYETISVHLALLGLCVIVFAGTLYGAIRWGKATWRASFGLVKLARPSAGLMALLNLLFLAALVITFVNNPAQLSYGFPVVFNFGLLMLMLSVPVTIVAALIGCFLWVRREWSIWSRVRYSVAVALGLLFLWSMNYWNLIGYHFG